MSVSGSSGTNEVIPAFAPLPCLGSIAIVALLLASVLSIRKVPVSGFNRVRADVGVAVPGDGDCVRLAWLQGEGRCGQF